MPPRRRRSRKKSSAADGEDSVMADLDQGDRCDQETEEAMVVVEEKWGLEEEVCMDVDMTEEDEQAFLSEIALTRGAVQFLSSDAPSLLPPPSSSLPSSSSNTVATVPQHEQLYLVLDTNVLLSHSGFLRELKDTPMKGVGRPVLVVPWVVMQELDSLKTSGKVKLGGAAGAAIKWLHDCFSSRHPRVKGQTMEEVQGEVGHLAIESNDDRILHCCLQYAAKVKGHRGKVVLFSNDIQLCSKALVNQITAISRKTLLVELRKLCYTMQHETTPTSSAAVLSDSYGAASPQHNKMIEDALQEWEGLVQELLSSVVQTEMELAFDTLWTSVVVIRPPWVLSDLFHIIDRHWIAVFGLVAHTSYRQVLLRPLLDYTRNKDKITPKWCDVVELVSSSITLLKAFPRHRSYQSSISSGITHLQKLVARARQGDTPPPSILSPKAGHARATPPSPPPPEPHIQSQMGHGGHTHILPLAMEEVGRLTCDMPALPQEQLPWILNVIILITQRILSKIAASLSSVDIATRRTVVAMAMHLVTLLDSIVTSVYRLVQGATVEVARQVRAALEVFLLTVAHEVSSLTDTLRLMAAQSSSLDPNTGT